MLSLDFETVYKNYADMLYRIAITDLCDVHNAQSAVQDTFVAYFKKNMQFENEEHLKAWLIRVLINKVKDELRRQKRATHISIDEVCELADIPKEELGIFEQVLKINEKYKTPLILHYFEDMPIERIAKILSLSESGVKMRLKRGREMLKIMLEQDL